MYSDLYYLQKYILPQQDILYLKNHYNNDYKDYITAKIVYGDIWLAGGDTGSHSLNIETPSGYIIVGIGRCQCSNTSNIIPYNVYISGDTLTSWCRNLTNGTAYTGNMNYTIYFRKN